MKLKYPLSEHFLRVSLIYNQMLKGPSGFRKFKTIELPCSFLGQLSGQILCIQFEALAPLAKVSFSLTAIGNLSLCTTETKHEAQAY